MSHTQTRYMVIAADAHAGPPVRAFRPYFERKYWEAFDEHVRDREAQRQAARAGLGGRYAAPSSDGKVPALPESLAVEGHPGLSDPHRRLRDMDAEGIAGEIIFPDYPHVVSNDPPFGGVSTGRRVAGPYNERTNQFYDPELQWAGARAYNRWLADFCSVQPERRAGIAIMPFHDVEAAVGEIQWAHKAGLRGGVLLPGIHPLQPGYSDPRYEPIWATCEELGMPLNCHGGNELPSFGAGPEATLIHTAESRFWAHRPLWWFLWGGILERHPNLSLVFTEQLADWVPPTLKEMEANYQKRAKGRSGLNYSLSPEGYWRRQCYVGARLTRDEVKQREQIGVGSIMWGSDYPHPEGTTPYSREALRWTFPGVPQEELHQMLGSTAAGVYHFDVPKLTATVARIGPTAEEVATPLLAIPAGYVGRGFE